MRAAHADYYLALVRRVAPQLRGADQAEAVRRSASSCRTCAPPRGTSSTPTGSTMPATSRGACSSTGGSPDSSPRCGCGCWNCSARSSPSRSAPGRSRWFFALWGEMWQRPSRAGRGGPRRVRATVHRERGRGCRGHGPRPRARPRGCSSPISTCTPGGGGAERGGRRQLRELGNTWAEAIAEVSLGRLAWCGGRIDEAPRALPAPTEIADAGEDCSRASVAGNNRDARALPARARSTPPRRSAFRTLAPVDAAALRGGRGVRARGHVRRRGRPRRGVARRRALGRGGDHPPAHGVFDVEAFTVHLAPLDAPCASAIPRASRPASGRAPT